ncbi:MAG TPA: 2-hydroxyglutaryl-CoA dehydratase [Syntrophomonadaceae bacterium]|nr:2-hydroxyglutaryl-CoA dehydratase [Syntrophomonadaceae bacterium]
MIGMDLGSRTVKIIQMSGEKLIAAEIYDSIDFYRRFGKEGHGSLRIDLNDLGFETRDRLVATGFGKITVQVKGAVHIPEIQAHVKGAVFQTGLSDFTLLDIGGQEIRVVRVERCRAVDQMSNDQCAASSGRYLENMAEVLHMSLEEISQYEENPVELVSTCAIFGESEIINKIVDGYDSQRLAAGINYSLYRRCAGMLESMKADTIVLSGGVSKNLALARIIERESGQKVIALQHGQLNGAIGCCVYGRQIFELA